MTSKRRLQKRHRVDSQADDAVRAKNTVYLHDESDDKVDRGKGAYT